MIIHECTPAYWPVGVCTLWYFYCSLYKLHIISWHAACPLKDTFSAVSTNFPLFAYNVIVLLLRHFCYRSDNHHLGPWQCLHACMHSFQLLLSVKLQHVQTALTCFCSKHWQNSVYFSLTDAWPVNKNDKSDNITNAWYGINT